MKIEVDPVRRAALALFACAVLAPHAALAQDPFSDSVPGLPRGGTYANVTFRSSFANQTDSGEEVILEVGAGYVCRVIGYVISAM